jgi:hypothetical protein
MSVDLSVPVYGLKDAIKQLNSVEPGLRTQITRDYRRIAKPVIDDAQSHGADLGPVIRYE